MRQFEFPQDVLAEIKRDRFEHPDPLVQRRMEVLWLKAHGETHVRIAELAGLVRATVQRILDQYQAGGLAAVRMFHWHVPTSELAPHRPPLNIELLFLPSYSPNLNLIERLGKFVKKAALNSREHSSFAQFQGVIDQCLDELPTTHQLQIRSLMTTTFQTFDNVLLLAA